jgi:hypothetical protein
MTSSLGGLRDRVIDPLKIAWGGDFFHANSRPTALEMYAEMAYTSSVKDAGVPDGPNF